MISTNFWWILGFIFFGISILFYSLGFNFAKKLGPPYDSDQAPGYIIAFIGISLVVGGFITSATFLLIPGIIISFTGIYFITRYYVIASKYRT